MLVTTNTFFADDIVLVLKYLLCLIIPVITFSLLVNYVDKVPFCLNTLPTFYLIYTLACVHSHFDLTVSVAVMY